MMERQQQEPFHSLFRSCIKTNITNKIAPVSLYPDKNVSPTSSYVILLQYSFPLHKRLTAAEPPSSSKSFREHQQAGLAPPKEIANRDLLGGFSFVKLAIEECAALCAGRIVLVKCLDNQNWGNVKTNNGPATFCENAVVVDLASDPLGWDLNTKDDGVCGKESKQRIMKGKILKMQFIFQEIQKAIEIIQGYNSFSSNLVMTKRDFQGRDFITAQQDSSQLQHSIPIVFDSISPLLLHHGVPKFEVLLQQLKSDGKNSSPIILPILTEAITPKYMCRLEDASDAVITANGGVASISRRSARLGGMYSSSLGSGGFRLIKEEQKIKEKREMVLLPHKEERETLSQLKSSRNTNVDGGEIERIRSGINRLGKQNSMQDAQPSGRATETNQILSITRPGFLQHEGKVQKIVDYIVRPQTDNGAKSKPRIFMEETDPEFDDLDDEDPDDDLDF